MKKFFAILLLGATLLCGCNTAAEPAGSTTVPQESTLPPNIMQKEDPSGDDVMNILLIGDSSCYYWTDELYGLLAAAGYETANVCNLYYSGCTPKMYWQWHEEGAAKYQLFTVNSEGRTEIPGVTLEQALKMRNWDILSFKNNSGSYNKPTGEESLATTEPYLTNLLAYVRGQYPMSDYYWQQNWAVEPGYNNGSYAMADVAQRTAMYQNIKYVSQEVSRKHGLKVVPCGDAWEPVRDLEIFRTPIEGVPMEKMTMCTRLKGMEVFDDFGHDGDIGGGQYLNACVWFEVLTGQSCVGNTFRPKYRLGTLDMSLTEEKIGILQKAAHDAVANLGK